VIRRIDGPAERCTSAGHVFLQDVVLDRAAQLAYLRTLLARHGDVIASRIPAGALMVMEVETCSSGISLKSVCMSSSEEIDTPTLPTSPCASGSSASYPICVGQVEGHRKAGLALLQQEPVARIGLFGGAKPGTGAWSTAASGTSSVARRGCRILAGRPSFWSYQPRLRPQRHARQLGAGRGREALPALRILLDRGLEDLLCPAADRFLERHDGR